MIKPPTLRDQLLSIIKHYGSSIFKESLLSIDVIDGVGYRSNLGDIRLTHQVDGSVHFYFEQYGRTFTLAMDGTLVETVEVVPTPPPEVVPTANPTEEEIFYRLIRDRLLPKELGETRIENVGRGAKCLLTYIKRGVIADFPKTDVILFYQFGTRRVKQYTKRELMGSKRGDILKREKERARVAKPEMVEQLGYKNKPEMVDRSVYSVKIMCECGNHRWIKKSDEFQCTKCKPCTIRGRRHRRYVSKRDRRRNVEG